MPTKPVEQYTHAMRFVIYVIDGSANLATGSEMEDINAFNDKLQADGQFIFAAGIAEPAQSTLVDNRRDLGSVSDGSLQTGPEHYSGFWLIQADSREAALKLAAAGSKACNRRVELRAFLGQ